MATPAAVPPRADEAPLLDLDGAEETPFEVEADLASPPSQQQRPLPAKAEVLDRARGFADLVSRRLSRPVRLYVTDNRSTMISFKREKDLLVLRVHHMFLGAPPEVVRAIADYAGRSARSASARIDAYVRQNEKAIRAGHRRGPRARLRAQGASWDLREILERINDAYFDGRIEARIGWGRAPAGRSRRTIRMGVYDHQTSTIRIHPALDRPDVPRFFVEYIVFHEMLHQAIPGKDRGRRRQHHGPEFLRRERAYPDYERAVAWERENISLLLGRPGGRRVRPVD